jgi:hypothetical protein
MPARDHLRGDQKDLCRSCLSLVLLSWWEHIWYEVLGFPVVCHWMEHGRIQICWIVIGGPGYKTPIALLTEERGTTTRCCSGMTPYATSSSDCGLVLHTGWRSWLAWVERWTVWKVAGRCRALKGDFGSRKERQREGDDYYYLRLFSAECGGRMRRVPIVGAPHRDAENKRENHRTLHSRHCFDSTRCFCTVEYACCWKASLPNIWFPHPALHSAENSLMRVSRFLWSALKWCFACVSRQRGGRWRTLGLVLRVPHHSMCIFVCMHRDNSS